jgi:small-conductance mechanosensitive channel
MPQAPAPISLGYTTLRTGDGREVVLPNSLAACQVVPNLTDRRSCYRRLRAGFSAARLERPEG